MKELFSHGNNELLLIYINYIIHNFFGGPCIIIRMEMAVTLATIATAIVSFAESNEWSQIYGLIMMPVSIGFCGYALYIYMERANMIRRKDPGPYEQKIGPIVLAALLAVTIVANFIIKIYDIWH